jgi:LmbE family N-acetylglucosaminyl deacetylase
MSEYIPERAMAIVAHPDDIEFGCGGTLAKWAAAGTRTSYVLCTSGDVGIDAPGMTRAQARQIREAEARQAAEIAGASEIIFLGEPDGLLQATLELRRRLVGEIRRFQPEVVITGDPTVVWGGKNYINHPDHRAAALAALEAIFPAAGQPNLFEEFEAEGWRAWKTRKVYITTWEGGDEWVDITATFDVKIAALAAHVSQMGGGVPVEMVREWAAAAGAAALAARGVAEGEAPPAPFLAEPFRVIELMSAEDWAAYLAKRAA